MSIRTRLFTKTLILFLSMATLSGCGHKSIDDQAEREAEEFTKQFCPTPVVNYSRTDSIKFDRKTRTYTYYCSLVDKADSEELISTHREQLSHDLINAVKQSPGMKAYIEAGIKFKFICRSGSNPQKILLVAE